MLLDSGRYMNPFFKKTDSCKTDSCSGVITGIGPLCPLSRHRAIMPVIKAMQWQCTSKTRQRDAKHTCCVLDVALGSTRLLQLRAGVDPPTAEPTWLRHEGSG